jgi:hypothetical protein
MNLTLNKLIEPAGSDEARQTENIEFSPLENVLKSKIMINLI